MTLRDVYRTTKEYDARGETITFNGGPCHGRTTRWPRPLPQEIFIPLEPTAEEMCMLDPDDPYAPVPFRRREVLYTFMPANYKTSRGVVVTALYDYVPPTDTVPKAWPKYECGNDGIIRVVPPS